MNKEMGVKKRFVGERFVGERFENLMGNIVYNISTPFALCSENE